MTKNQKTIAVVFIILLVLGIMLYLLRKKMVKNGNGGGGNDGGGGDNDGGGGGNDGGGGDTGGGGTGGDGGGNLPKWTGRVRSFVYSPNNQLLANLSLNTRPSTPTISVGDELVISGGTPYDGSYRILFLLSTSSGQIFGIVVNANILGVNKTGAIVKQYNSSAILKVY